MADVPEEVCAFCEEGEEAGSLQNTSDDRILAHYNCMLFSPGVITTPVQDSQDNKTEFDINSVIYEIRRGRKLNCSYKPCKIKGASIGCDIKKCRRTYHYNCVTKAGGEHIKDVDNEKYIVYCFKHKRSGNNEDRQNCQLGNDPETSVTCMTSACSNKACENQTPKKRKKKMKHINSDVRKRLKSEDTNVHGTVENVEIRYNSEGARRTSNQLSDNHTNEEDTEVPGPSRTYQQYTEFHIISDSDDSHSSQIRTGQTGGMRVKRKHSLPDHTDQEDMEAKGSCTPMLNQSQKSIVIQSDSESEEDFPTFNGSQLVNIKREGNSTIDDTSGTSAGGLKELMPSTPREGSGSSTDCSDPSVPKIHLALSLSGFPKTNKRRIRERDNPKLETALATMNSDERDAYSQLYDEVGGQTEDKPPSTGEIVEDEPILVAEKIPNPDEDPADPFSDTTNAAVLAAKCSQTEISSGFPANVNKPVNLKFNQKSQLMECYKETEKQMSRTGDMEAGAAKAFWDLCQENRCRELLLTLVTCCIKSVLHKIVHEEPEDRDFDQAFAFLQASGALADFIKRTEDDQAEMNSRIGIKGPNNKTNPDNVGFCTEVEGQGKFTRDKDPDKMEPELPETTSINNKVLQYARDEDHNKVNAECSKTSSLSVSNTVKESAIDEDHRRMQSNSSESSSKSSRKKESSRNKCHDGKQPDLSKSSSKSSRKKESSRDECPDGMQHDLSKSSSKSSRAEESAICEDSDRKGKELAEASLFSPSVSSKSDLTLAENTSRGPLTSEELHIKILKRLGILKKQQKTILLQHQQQTGDGDAAFATNLVKYLRKLPEDKMLDTKIALLIAVSSVLDQKPMSTLNPGCAPKQHTNTSTP